MSMKSARCFASLVSASSTALGLKMTFDFRPLGRLRLPLLDLGALLWITGVERQSERTTKLGWASGVGGCMITSEGGMMVRDFLLMALYWHYLIGLSISKVFSASPRYTYTNLATEHKKPASKS